MANEGIISTLLQAAWIINPTVGAYDSGWPQRGAGLQHELLQFGTGSERPATSSSGHGQKSETPGNQSQ